MRTQRLMLPVIAAIVIHCGRVTFAADAPDPACPVCHGLGIVPNLPYKPYVRLDSQPPETTIPPAWKYCEKCQKGLDPKAISEEMKTEQDRARANHKVVVEKSGIKMELVLTPYVAIHSNMPLADTRRIADVLERCVALLLNSSKTMVLGAARCDANDMFLFKDQKSYETFIDKVHPDAAAYKGNPSFSYPHISASRKNPTSIADDASALSDFTGMLLVSATDGKAPDWLLEGFEWHCEKAICGKIMTMHSAAVARIPSATNWNDLMRKFATSGKEKKWEDIFGMKRTKLSEVDGVSIYSLVTCLIELDAARFDKSILNLKTGDGSAAAIEKAYGRKLDDLQTYWLQWVPKQK